MRFLKSLIKGIIYAVIPPPLQVGTISYSQAGEDLIIDFLIKTKNIGKFEYLDIGTNLPEICNNTFMFYLRGNHGVCVEANPSLIPEIKLKRLRDKVINAGVSVKADIISDFYIFENSQICTFDKLEAERRTSSGKNKIIDIVKVPMHNINTLIRNNFTGFPTLLSIDAEGYDFEIIQSLDFDKYPIPVICIETCEYSENHIISKDSSVIHFMKSKQYDVYADTYINTIFVNRDWFNK